MTDFDEDDGWPSEEELTRLFAAAIATKRCVPLWVAFLDRRYVEMQDGQLVIKDEDGTESDKSWENLLAEHNINLSVPPPFSNDREPF